MKRQNYKINELNGLAQFTLFVSSYLPLFFLIILRQLSDNHMYLVWGGISQESLYVFVSKFGLSAVLLVVSLLGAIGYIQTLGNIEEVAKNGAPVQVIDVKNKNNEAIGYIATYIIPFLFQSFDGWFEIFSIIFLLFVIYRVYINSSMILINPLLSFKYSIYEIEYLKNQKNKNGLIISRNKYLQDDDFIKIYEIGHKLFFARDN